MVPCPFKTGETDLSLKAWVRRVRPAWPGIGREGCSSDAELFGRQEGVQQHYVVQHLKMIPHRMHLWP